MAKPLLVEKDGPFLHVTLNRPRNGNLVTPPMLAALTETATKAAREPGLRALVLRGRGKDFCHGRVGGKGNRPPTAFAAHERIMGPILGVYDAFRRLPVPVLAVVQGRALGFGCAMVGASDVAIAAASARFALPEMKHGIPPTLAISALVPRVAAKTVADLVYSTEEIDASSAFAAGLVSRVVADGELDAAADRFLDGLRQYDVAAIRVIKGYIGKAGRLDPEAASDLAGYTLATAFTRND